MKIRLRISIWGFLTTLIVLLTFSLGTYLAMRHLLFQTLDDELDMILSDVEASYEPETYRFSYLTDAEALVNRHLKQYYLKVYNSIGEAIYSSQLAEMLSLEVTFPKQRRELGYTVPIHTAALSDLRFAQPKASAQQITFRIVTRKLFYQQQVIGYATIAVPIEDIETSLYHLLEVLIIAGLFTMILIGVGSYFMTRQALDPVATITRKTQNISHTKLNQRLPVKHPDDELGQLSQVLNDLLERLQRAFASQQQFLSDVAHELKTPLAILRAHWEDEINNPELSLEVKEQLIQDIETITRLNHLVNSLRLLSRTEQIESSFDFEIIRWDEILQDVLADVEVLAEAKRQNIIVDQLASAEISGDHVRLYQLAFNLIDNAV
ncbi:MAG TPA: HAMP domain-containing protein, partial [bacterium]|nr:HAMP domain-containing protein [bacterium]